MLKGNKGEWSEIYVLLKLLSNKELSVGDENLTKIPGLLYPIVKILRDEGNDKYTYSVNDNLILISGEDTVLRIPIYKFKRQAETLLLRIKEANSSSFEVPEIEVFLTKIKCSTLKAKSSLKTDIRIVINDFRANLQPELGFSIKSQLGCASTLLNAGRSTNFVYRIESCDFTETATCEVNAIDTRRKVKDRLMLLLDKKCEIKFSETEKDVFANNLILIDSLLPEILAKILFSFFTTTSSSLVDLVEKIERENPLDFNVTNNHRFYEYKIKKFLTEVALGMMPSTVWDGQYDATGGYLIVKENGEILSYHIYDNNRFENYLYHNTKLETASTTRHDFGSVFMKAGELFIKLNLQIRFKK